MMDIESVGSKGITKCSPKLKSCRKKQGLLQSSNIEFMILWKVFGMLSL